MGSSSTGVLALSSNIGPLWFCDLLSVSNLAYPTVVVVLFLPPSSFRPLSVSVGCVPRAFAMGSPWPGSSVGVVFLLSIGTKA